MTGPQIWLWNCIAYDLRWHKTLDAFWRIDCELRRATSFLKDRTGRLCHAKQR